MKILLLGATGRTGKYLLAEALDRGHIVHALVRDKSRITTSNNNLFLFEGLPTNEADLAHAMKDCDAILSVLNISRTSDFPWAKLRTPASFLSDAIKIIAKVAAHEKIKRMIICSAWGANETKKDIPGWFRWLIDNSNIGVAYRDHEVQENYLKGTGFEYTIVRPVGLTNSEKEQVVCVTLNDNPKPTLTISRKSTAKFMLEVLDKNLFVKQAVTISKQ